MTVGSGTQPAPQPRMLNLRMHTRNHIPSDIAMGTKDFKPGTLIEIRQDEASLDQFWMAFEVGACRDDIPKDVISVEQSLATQLRLRPHANIQVRPAEASDHCVSLIELLIKEQYLSQADLWLLARNLGGSCVHVGKLIEFQGMRATVKLLWRQGESLLSGYLSPDPHQTKVVFRSATASISIFILMTREMWQYDLAGDLCFQLVVCGLLADLFYAWHERGCTHDVTIVMATRVIYDANNSDNFPDDIRPAIQHSPKGQVYEDVYEVIVQNERFDDWNDTLMALNKSFISFDERVLRKTRTDLPRRRLAFSAEAPVLESMNVVLNAMDTYRLDHRFDRTGNALILVSASQGVYDVDKRLKSITKKRVIESGLAVDLVSVLPQPFHPVPLFRMFDEMSTIPHEDDEPLTFEYALPNDWINVSFYQATYSTVSFMAGETGEEYDTDDRRAVAVFDVSENDNFSNKLSIARIDLKNSVLSLCSGKSRDQLLNPFLPSMSSSTVVSNDRDRSSRPHSNRWLHALPQNELGQTLQIHHSRYRSSTGAGSNSRRAVRQNTGSEHSDILTGVDWKSLVLPAVLPNTAAAGPALEAWLKEACVESPHDVFFSCSESSQPEQPLAAKPSGAAAGFRRPQSPQEVFDLLVLLRLAAGFQLVLAPQQQDLPAQQYSTAATKLGEFFKIQRNPPVLMASGRYYQKLELMDAESKIVVTKFVRTKRGIAKANSCQVESSVFQYPFMFRVPDIETFNFASTEFVNRRPDLLNLWASLDYHVISPTPDMDDLKGYSMKECFWKSYFAVLPLLNLPSSNSGKGSSNAPANTEIDWNKIADEATQPSIQFQSLTRLVGYINGLGTFRPVSQSTPVSTPTDASLGPDKQQMHIMAHLQVGLDSQGLAYVESSQQQATQIRFYTTFDAVNWLMNPTQQQLYGFDSIDSCMAILNECINSERIFSPSLKEKNLSKLYYGIYYFSFVNPVSSALGNRGENLVEIAFGVWHHELPVESSVMLSVDAAGRGGRHELAMIVHDSVFVPGCNFRLRLEWLFASGSFLCELVDAWHHRARSFGLHLLPIPSNAFDLTASDPLRLIIEVPFAPEVVVRLLKSGSKENGEEKSDEKEEGKGEQKEISVSEEECSRVTNALLRHFAFIPVVGPNASTDYFVHLSGVAFVRRMLGAIEWAWNFQVSRRWQNILENDAGDLLLAKFRHVSSNVDNSLLELVKQKGVLGAH